MGLRELAEMDLGFTLENVDGTARELVLTNPEGDAFVVMADISDIGIQFDTEGNAMAGRSVNANYRMSALVNSDGSYVMVTEQWQAVFTDLVGKSYDMNVTRAERDRTLGICRLWLSLD